MVYIGTEHVLELDGVSVLLPADDGNLSDTALHRVEAL